MARKSLIDLELELRDELRKYYEDPMRYARAIKNVVRRHDPSARVLLFGSIVRGNARADSDIDVLVITDLASEVSNRLHLIKEMNEEIGIPNPFEIHIVTWEEFTKWYRKFIDKHIEV